MAQWRLEQETARRVAAENAAAAAEQATQAIQRRLDELAKNVWSACLGNRQEWETAQQDPTMKMAVGFLGDGSTVVDGEGYYSR